ncbi:MAG: SusC/RagA family TonB-linked outer membrane protein [Candidatus Cryptobacteroides sp.]|nr:SusC/RagA family TonB-linked outer membrane protein [Bacteroidales bacterium]MDY3964412.1 SusC/RagA family TonB-linked outer membrane protein [Candidatus Cryptobacteroides sp.]
MKALFSAVLLIFACVNLSAQERVTASGTVIDENKIPMIGVSVIEKGTHNGTMTDIDGNWSMEVTEGAVLEFSYIGYTSVELPAAAGMNLQMEVDTRILEEVVVVGYGVQKKSSLTGSVSQVKAEDMEARTITSAGQALQGKTSGVQVLSGSAKPGASPSIRIRGVSSNNSSDPLYVVDGRLAKDISGIDPNDIESMEVLKDGASAAIYGAEAGNGVVLITTKKGKGKGKITYDYQYSSQSVSKVPHLMNSEQFIDFYTEANLISLEKFYNNWDFETNTDWIKAGFEKSNMHKHNLTFSAGDSDKSIYISGTYLNNDGIVVGDKDYYKRLTGMINASWKVKPWLEIGTNNQVEYYKSASVAEGSEYSSYLLSLLTLDPLTKPMYPENALPAHMQQIYNDTSHAPMLGDGKGNIYGVSAYVTSESVNPYIMLGSSDSYNRGFNINGTTYINFMPVKGLTVTSRLGYRLGSYENYGISHDYYASGQIQNKYLSVSAGSNNAAYWQWENFLNYTKQIKKHNFGIMLGTSFSESRSFGVSGSKSGNENAGLGFKKDDPLFWYFAYAVSDATKDISGGEPSYGRKLSYFGRANYEYDNRYMVQVSLRADAADSSVLPVQKRWGYFPAVSAGWVISNEKFMQNSQAWLNHLKIRASWGQNGSTASLGGYQYANVIASTGSYPTSSENPSYGVGYAPSATGNKELKWETAEQTNVGIDARFFRSRLTFSADWFRKETKDLIVTGITPSTVVGNTASPVNAGNIRNTGFEVELGWQDMAGDFSYGIRGNISTLKNEVTYIHPTLSAIDGATYHTYGAITRFEVGKPAWYFYGYEFTGIDKATGNPTFKDQNNDGSITDSDKTMIGKGMADATYGITLTAAWKGIDLIVFGTGSIGNDIYCCLNRSDYTLNKLTYFTEDRWKVGHENGTMPKAGANDMDKFYLSTASVINGSYFKIKQIQLGYTFPAKWMSKIKVENLRIYASLDDFFVFTKYPGLDPEVTGIGNALGVDKGSYPNSRKIVAGVSITF